MQLSPQDPTRLVQTSIQWALLVSMPDEPINARDEEGLERVFSLACGARNREEVRMHFSALRDRGLIAVTSDLATISIRYEITDLGRRVRAELGTHGFWEGIDRDRMIQELACPVEIPQDPAETEPTPYDETVTHGNVEEAYGRAWTESQRIMADWCSDVASRLRV